MEQILTAQDHECVTAFTGTSKFRKLPDYFSRYFSGKIIEFYSPNFIRDSENKSILILRSFIYNLCRAAKYFRSIKQIHKKVKELQPDLIISFYEPLTGLYRFFYRQPIPCISVAHQFGAKYTGYISGGSIAEVFAISLLTKIAAFGSDKLFCIYPEEKAEIREKGIVFIPPLIRNEFKQAKKSNNGSITCYLLNSGYKSEVINWQKSHPEQEINCFTETTSENDQANSNMQFHELDDKSYIAALSSCSALISTAGFESVCEAMYLGKPVLMVPVKNHYEQHLNSVFFERFGAGIRSHFFDIDNLLKFTRSFKPAIGLIDWTDKGPAMIEKQILELLNIKTGK
jgi:uncharacterized protein (TIGR00661 family)